ncbi:MAG: nicotinate (nicotinamide) nucleotide adenylyltransferase [Sedimentisphaerales bacterium]
MPEKIILFGGTYDPVHIGHIEVAQSAAGAIGASKVILIPARRSPHKEQKPAAPDNNRIAMLKLAIAGKNIFQISPVELNRAEPSYTIDTIRHFKQKFGADCQLYWLIGADMLKDLPKWYKIDELLKECTICVMNRGGFDRPDCSSLTAKLGKEAVEKLRQNQIETQFIEISSTDIRQKLLDGKKVGQYLHPKVLDYIKTHRLYTATD